MVDIEVIEGTIQSRGAKVKKIRKLYSKSDEEKMYLAAIDKLSKTFPKFVKPEDIQYLNTKGRVFLVDYEREFNGEHYTRTHDVSTKWIIHNGEIDETLLHELIHRYTFVRGIITQEDFAKNAPYYEGATELATQNAFGFVRESRVIKKGDKSYKVNLCDAVAYPEQVALLRQINLLLGDNFVEQSILQDSKALETEMSKQFGEHTYTMFFEKMADTMNGRTDNVSICKAIDTIQTLILENCCVIKFEKAKTEQNYLDFMNMMRELGQMRLATEENQIEFINRYNMFYNLAREKFIENGYDLSKLEEYDGYEYTEYPRTDKTKVEAKNKAETARRKKEDLAFVHNNTFVRMADKVISEDTDDIDLYISDLEGDNGVIATFVAGTLVGVTRRAKDRFSSEILSVSKNDYGAYVGISRELKPEDFTDSPANCVYIAEKRQFFDSSFSMRDYFIDTEDGMIGILTTNGKRTALNLQKADAELKKELLDGIRSRAEVQKYFQKQKDEIGKELGLTFYR